MEDKDKSMLAKMDMVIIHISDCILELDSSHAEKGIPEMARALAELVKARNCVTEIYPWK